MSDKESRCESHFANTHSRQPDGRYIVRLPFKTGTPIPIGKTELAAEHIFLNNEGRLARQRELAKAYREFMREYEELEHMESLHHSDQADTNCLSFTPRNNQG